MTVALAEKPLTVDGAVLARFMPMHLLLDPQGRALSFGPTLARVLRGAAVPGARFEELFEVRSPGGSVTIQDVLARNGNRFRLLLRGGAKTSLRGLGMRIAGEDRILVNLTFVDLVSAVRDHALSDSDFAATEMATELLFLAEWNTTVLRELKGLTLRLDGARVAAEEEALTDPLTGLRNRRAVDLLQERLCKAHANFGLMHMDLDFFKAVNDTLGHAAGDFVLENVGRILREQLRAEDCAARIGGDEFVMIIVGRSDPRTMMTVANRIISQIREPMLFEGQRVEVSASIGIVRSTNCNEAMLTHLVASADRALYAAKHAGRGKAVLAD
ncbi:MAG: diguanylate cyclase [Tabrizicola sp.]